jgi:hypothetical protein
MKHIYLILIAALSLNCESNLNSEPISGGSGRGGSLARFTIVKNNLYVVDNSNLKVFNITNPKDPVFVNNSPIDAFAETIFPFGENLLIGTRTGMYVYNISQPNKPTYVSQYSHFASCDPVVAEGDFAYVTLRNGTPCMRGQNQLDILNISNLSNPRLVNSVQLLNPHGLGVNGNILFVTEGDAGFRIFDRSDPANPELIKFVSNIPAFDVIPLANTLILTGTDGIYQFAYDQQGNIDQLSKIAVIK